MEIKRNREKHYEEEQARKRKHGKPQAMASKGEKVPEGGNINKMKG